MAAINAADPAGPRPARRLQPKPVRRSRPLGGLALAVALTVALAAGLSLVGGVSFAANAARDVARVARTVLVTRTHQTPMIIGAISAGGDQYRPGYGFGDPNHNHAGPPGLRTAPPGEKAPPPQSTLASDGKAIYVLATVSSDEQAALYFSVLDSTGTQLLLTQRGSKIGGNVAGPQTKTIHYVMLVPRTVPIRLRIPKNLVHPGEQYTIRVIAVDAQGNKSRILIPFSV